MDNNIYDIWGEALKFSEARRAAIGVCRAEPFLDCLPELAAARTPFVRFSPEERIDPALCLPGCKSVIAAAVPVGRIKPPRPDYPHGEFSLLSALRDYHLTVAEFLEDLAGFLGRRLAFSRKIFVDTGNLPEKEVLYRAGLAARGRSGLALSPEFGSRFNAGVMLTDIDFGDAAANQPPENHGFCASCGLCEKSCPTGAIGERFDPYKCVSYLTQKKGALTEAERAAMGANLYGCDACADVCPLNSRQNGGVIATGEIYPSAEAVEDMTRLDKTAFAERYKERVFFYKGIAHFRRNAEIVLRNIRQV
ncbi:MAG: DUF1730 domain-containing protein [Clostridiales bacterium]|jgi:epoxyqueuosine reductase|nr:DUF1730 domain-containing protein [Clostridiales bacterium]